MAEPNRYIKRLYQRAARALLQRDDVQIFWNKDHFDQYVNASPETRRRTIRSLGCYGAGVSGTLSAIYLSPRNTPYEMIDVFIHECIGHGGQPEQRKPYRPHEWKKKYSDEVIKEATSQYTDRIEREAVVITEYVKTLIQDQPTIGMKLMRLIEIGKRY